MPSPLPTTNSPPSTTSARTVHLPNGTKLEAHSGLREYLDDPRYVNVRMRVENAMFTGGPVMGFSSGRLTTIFGSSGLATSTMTKLSLPGGDRPDLPSSSQTIFSSLPMIRNGLARPVLVHDSAKASATKRGTAVGPGASFRVRSARGGHRRASRWGLTAGSQTINAGRGAVFLSAARN